MDSKIGTGTAIIIGLLFLIAAKMHALDGVAEVIAFSSAVDSLGPASHRAGTCGLESRIRGPLGLVG